MISRRRFLILSLSAAALPALTVLPRRTHEAALRVTADSAPIRAWAADDAPLIARLPQGAQATLTDRLLAREGAWIAVRDALGRAGWSRAALWTV